MMRHHGTAFDINSWPSTRELMETACARSCRKVREFVFAFASSHPTLHPALYTVQFEICSSLFRY